MFRTFCGKCGTPLTYQRAATPDKIDVTTVSLARPDDFAPTKEIWIEHKLAWESLNADLEHYPRSSAGGASVLVHGEPMPLVTLTVREGKSREFKSAVLGAVHNALVASGVPEKDRFQRVLELGADDFRFDADYPDLAAPRTDDFVLIEILLSVGRSVKVKKQILTHIIDALSKTPGLNRDSVMVVFKETSWENWAFGGGRLIHT